MADVKVSESIVIGATPEVVFDHRLDFTTLPSYNPHVSNVRRIDEGTAPGVGAEYMFDLALPGAPEPIACPLRVIAAERPETITIESGPDYIAHEVWTLTEADVGTHILFEQTIRLEGEIPEEALAPIHESASEQSRIELHLLKKILET